MTSHASSIYIYGAGGHGAVVAEIAQLNGYTPHFLDDADPEQRYHPQLQPKTAIIAIGSNPQRQRLFEQLQQDGFTFPPLIHPRAIVSPQATIEAGSVVMAGAIINPRAHIEQGCIINSGAIIEHDCHIGAFSHISPNAALAGNVQTEPLVHIGIGASVRQNTHIASGSIIGAGAVLLNDTQAHTVYYGVPARPMRPA